MSATTRTRPTNRVAPFLPSATAAPVAVPASPRERQAAYADAVLAALLTLQGQLRHPDTKISQTAAVAIVDLEKTRLRHGEAVVGTNVQSERLEDLDRPHGFAATERSGTRNPAPAGRGEENEPVAPADSWEEFVDQVWDDMQEDADAAGRDEVISQAQAEERARFIHAEMRKQAAVAAPPNSPVTTPPGRATIPTRRRPEMEVVS